MLRSRLHAAATGREESIAISREELAWTFGELERWTNTLTMRLSNTSRPPKIAAGLPGGPEFTALQFACAAANTLFAPVPARATQRELRHILQLVPCDFVVVPDRAGGELYGKAGAQTILFEELARGERIPPPREDAADPRLQNARLLQLTSGSTGKPHGVLLTEDNLIANLDQNEGFLAGFADQHVFCPLFQSQAMGGAIALEHLCSGSPVHFANRFDPASDIARMAEHGCTGLWTSPHYAHLLLRLGLLQQGPLPAMRDLTLGTATVSSGLVSDLQRALPEARIHIRYGIAEAHGPIARLTLHPGEELPGTGVVGVPAHGVEVRADGELLARAPGGAEFGLGDDGALRSLRRDGGFLSTGDLAEVGADGTVRLFGRKALTLNVHGHRVDPAEIEILLREIPGVGDAVVLGLVPGDTTSRFEDERIVACLEPVPGQTCPESSQLQAACDDGLSPHKLPSQYVTFERLPRTPSGKPDRQALRELLSSQSQARG
jgi:acyl-CoA synthetase (AMP-forming)/AMP-acid ligase II